MVSVCRSSLSTRPRHGSHSEDVLSRYSTSRERSVEPRASSSSSLTDSVASRSREGSVAKSRLALDASPASSSASVSGASARLEARGSAYTGAASGKLGRPPLHSSLSSAAASAADSSAAATPTYSRSRAAPTTAATMTTSTGKPFHSRFLKPKPVAEDKPAGTTSTATSSASASTSDKEVSQVARSRGRPGTRGRASRHAPRPRAAP